MQVRCVRSIHRASPTSCSQAQIELVLERRFRVGRRVGEQRARARISPRRRGGRASRAGRQAHARRAHAASPRTHNVRLRLQQRQRLAIAATPRRAWRPARSAVAISSSSSSSRSGTWPSIVVSRAQRGDDAPQPVSTSPAASACRARSSRCGTPATPECASSASLRGLVELRVRRILASPPRYARRALASRYAARCSFATPGRSELPQAPVSRAASAPVASAMRAVDQDSPRSGRARSERRLKASSARAACFVGVAVAAFGERELGEIRSARPRIPRRAGSPRRSRASLPCARARRRNVRARCRAGRALLDADLRGSCRRASDRARAPAASRPSHCRTGRAGTTRSRRC